MARRATADNVLKLTRANLPGLTVLEGATERVVWDAEVRGFGIRIRASGARAWIVRPPRGGSRSKIHTIGAATGAGALDLTTARIKAVRTLADVVHGADPTEAKREARARAAVTIGTQTENYLASQAKRGRRPSTIVNDRHALTVHCAPLRDRPLADVTRAEIAKRFKEIEAKSGRFAADRARTTLIAFFGWAIREGFLEANPAANTNTIVALEDRRRDRVLTDDELRDVWQHSDAGDFGNIVKLLILTAQRRDEISAMSWPEIDTAKATWTLPASRSKNKQAHTLPCTSAMRAILDTIPRRNATQFLFGVRTGRSFQGWSKAKRQLDERIAATRVAQGRDPMPGWRLHDLRRTARTRMADLRIHRETAEAILNHVGGFKGGVSAHYDHSDYLADKLEALKKWGAYVAKIVVPKVEA